MMNLNQTDWSHSLMSMASANFEKSSHDRARSDRALGDSKTGLDPVRNFKIFLTKEMNSKEETTPTTIKVYNNMNS